MIGRRQSKKRNEWHMPRGTRSWLVDELPVRIQRLTEAITS
ncbi:hypothetical protein PT974_12592 [Cladobotryum mycophilum]|uniref:Uncharacterized protein n=1 Tax=Cladobotryum mycophilum TaxID=491253 RepID=A0ABR0S8D8_9HYPO